MSVAFRAVCFMLLWVTAATGALGQDYFVDQARGDDAFDGLSWATPKCTIQAAVDASTGMLSPTISVAEGTYRETVEWRVRDLSLTGGFAAGGSAWDPSLHRTVIDGEHVRNGIRAIGTFAATATTALVGLEIRRASTFALVFAGSNFVLRNCHFEENGLHPESPTVRYSIVSVNSDWTSDGPFTVLIEECVFRRNVLRQQGTQASLLHAILHFLFSGNTIVRRCTFEDNLHERLGSCDLYAEQMAPDMTLEDVTLDAARFDSDWLRLRNVLVRRELGFGQGVQPYPNEFTNLTAGQLRLISAGGWPVAPTIIRDSILLGEVDGMRVPSITGPVDELSFFDISDSIVRGGWPAGTRIIDADPLLVGGPLGNHYLAQVAAGDPLTSPGVDSGSRDASAAGLDAATTRADGATDSGLVDMGYHYPPHVGDLVIRRSTDASALAAHATVTRLPWSDAPGTASDPTMPLLFYDIPGTTNHLFVSLDRAADTLRLDWR